MLESPQVQSTPDRPSVSVALATYNGAKHLDEQLQSLAEQSLLPLELVVTDDGSTDSTIEILRAFADRSPFPVQIHHNTERLGYGGNFLRAASLCQGDLIAFCDQDDRWLESKLATCASYFQERDVKLVIHSAETWNGHTRLKRQFPFHEETRITVPGITDPFTLVPGFAVVFRRELLQLADNRDRPGCLFGLTNGSIMAHDSWIWLLAATTGKVAQIKDVLALYRQHETNTVGAPGKTGLRRRLQLARDQVNYQQLADFENKVVEVLSSIPDAAAPDYVVERRDLIRRLRRRADLHGTRAVMYQPGASLGSRLRSFFALFSRGAYRPAESSNRLGPRTAVKDLFYGVSGLYKRLT